MGCTSYDIRVVEFDEELQSFTIFPTEWKMCTSLTATGNGASAFGDLYGFGPYERIDQNPGYTNPGGAFWVKLLKKALDAGDSAPGDPILLGEHLVYRVQVRLATAAATVSSLSQTPGAVLMRRRRAAKRTRFVEVEEEEDRVTCIRRDEQGELEALGQ